MSRLLHTFGANMEGAYVKSVISEINAAIRYMRGKGINPNALYVDEDTYLKLGRRDNYNGIPVICDDEIQMPFRVD